MASTFRHKIKCGTIDTPHRIVFQGDEFNKFAREYREGKFKSVSTGYIYISTSSHGKSNDFIYYYRKADGSMSRKMNASFSNIGVDNECACFKLKIWITNDFLGTDPYLVIEFVDGYSTPGVAVGTVNDGSYGGYLEKGTLPIGINTAYIGFDVTCDVPSVKNVEIYRDYKNLKVAFKANLSNSCFSKIKAIVNGYDTAFMGVEGSNVIEVPEAYFNIGRYNKISVSALCYSEESNFWKIDSFYFAKTIPTLNSLEINSPNGYIDEDVSVTIEGYDYTRYEIYNNGFLVATGNFSPTVLAVIPKNKLVVGKNLIYIKLHNDLHDAMYGDYVKSITSSTKNVTLKAIVPTVSNLTIENEDNLIDHQTMVSWVSTYQSFANVYANEKLIYTVNGSATAVSLPPGAFKVGSTKIRVEVIKKGIEGVSNTETSASAQTSINFKRIEPTITKDSFSISDTNIDHVITATWEATNQSRCEIYQDNVLIITGGASNSIDIPEGRLISRTTKLKLVVIYDSGFDSISTEMFLETTLTMNIPTIYYLEPSGVSVKVDDSVKVSIYTNEFCDRWELNAAGYITTGTSERTAHFGSGMFKNGLNTMMLTIYYSPSYDKAIVRTATKTVSFNGYGKPSTPIFDGNELYASGYPKFTWESDEQVEYMFSIKKFETDEIIESNRDISVNKFYQVETMLEDRTKYLVELKIKNKYDEWSDLASKVIETCFNTLLVPEMSLAVKDGVVKISISGYQEKTFKSASILRKAEGEDEWLEIADNLNTIDSISDPFASCNKKLFYKVRVFDVSGSPSDGPVKEIYVPLKNYLIADTEDSSKTIRLNFVTKSSLTYNNDEKAVLYAGLKHPRIFKGKVNYISGSYKARSLTAEQVNEFIEFVETGDTFCFKDYRGGKIYCHISITDIEDVNYKYQNVGFTITEVAFEEKKMYSGRGYMKLTYMDGEYNMDDTIKMSGEDPNYVPVEEG